MNSVLVQLYMGNIRPESRQYPPESPFVKAAKVKNKNMEKLMATLDESEQEVFEKYCDAQVNIEEITRYNTLTYALKFGMLLMLEILVGSGAVVGEVQEL